jgi:hypothetical protein
MVDSSRKFLLHPNRFLSNAAFHDDHAEDEPPDNGAWSVGG